MIYDSIGMITFDWLHWYDCIGKITFAWLIVLSQYTHDTLLVRLVGIVTIVSMTLLVQCDTVYDPAAGVGITATKIIKGSM